jgi:hypothetical protein
LTITAVKSQEKIQFGVKGGINLTNITSDFMIDKESQTGFHIGVLAEIPFGNKFSLQPEILYSTYGSKGKMIMLGGSPQPIEYNLDYIQVPVLAKIYLIKNLSLEIGPSFNFLINDEEIFNSLTIDDIGESFEFSGILGISYKTNSGFFGSFRHTNGFTNTLQDNSRDEKNYGFLIGIGYMF